MIDEKKIEAKLDEIHDEMIELHTEMREELRALREAVEKHLCRPAIPPRTDDLVPVEYLVQRTGRKARTILEGKAGMKSLLDLRVEKHPSLWRRGDVDRWLRDREQKREDQQRRNFGLVKRGKRRSS
jgi:hypothetical protein